MKLLLLLLPFAFLMNPVQEPVQTADTFGFELTVTAKNADAAPFNITISGVELAQNGDRTPFSLNQENAKTPYTLTLKDGQYTVTVETKAPEAGIESKVQGIRNGSKMGYASGNHKKTILEFGPGGTYSARGE
jgi:hypothetical protein